MKIIPVLCDIRSLHNVGSLLRTADGLGFDTVYTVGYTPHMKQPGDARLPHVIKRAESQLAKTALGAERAISNRHLATYDELFAELDTSGYEIIGLETGKTAKNIFKFKPPGKLALLLGPELDGLSETVLAHCHEVVEIPMSGSKKSFNVAVAGGIALSYLINHQNYR